MSNRYLYKGRHRAKKKNPHKVIKIASLSPLALPLLPFPSIAAADPPGGWGPIIECESGGRNVENASPSSSASGYFQIIDGTWRANGGTQFASRAIGASFEEQKIVANRIYERRGSLADWNASRSCWAGKSGGVEIEAEAEAEVDLTPSESRPQNLFTCTEDFLYYEVCDPHNLGEKVSFPSEPRPRPEPEPTVEVEAENYVVVRGDTLSEIAARAAGGMTWQEIFEANRDVIGSNPDLIFPGQKLRVSD